MTLILATEFTVDPSKGVSGLKQAAAALSDAKVKTLETASAAKAASAALAELEKQNRKSGAATAAMAEEERRLREALAKASLEATAAQRAFQQLDIAQTKLSQSGGRGVQTAGQQRAVYQQLGFQISDVAAQASVGTSAFVILAQQGGQTAAALSGFGGVVGRVAGFLSGPLGAALLGVVTVLGVLASKSDEGSGALNRQEAAAKAHKQAVEDLEKATGQLNRTQEESLRVSSAAAEADLKRALAARVLIQAELEKAQAFARSVATTQAQGGAGDPGSRAGDAGAAIAAQVRIQSVQAELAANAAASATLQTNLANAKYATTLARVRGELDPVVKATQAYERETTRLRASFTAGRTSEAALNAGLLKAEKDLEAARNASRESGKAARNEAAASRKVAADAQAAAKKALAEEAAVAKKAADEAAQRAREDQQLLVQLERQYDSAAAAVRAYSEAVGGINRLEAGGKLTAGQAADYRGAAGKDLVDSYAKQLTDTLPEAAREAGEQQGVSAAEALFRRAEEIGSLIGGRAGDAAASAIRGLQTGDFRGVGGRAGAGLQAVSDAYRQSPELQSAGKDVVKKLGEVFGDQPFFKNFAANVGPYLAAAGQGAGIGGAVGGGSTASQIGGAIGSVAGKALGTAIAGPLGGAIGSLAGSILGGLIGGALVKPKTGSVTLSGSGGEVVTGAATGTGASQRANATSLGGSVGGTLNQIIERLGGEVGKFAVSIGQEGGRFRVDTAGQGRTKKGGGVIGFGEDEGAAVQAALADAIRDGAVGGVSPRVSAALKKYATDVNKAVAEALKVQGLETLLADRENPFSSVFQDFERQAKERLKIAKAYGFDVLEIEKVNAEERAKLLREQLTDATSSVKALLDDLKFGSRAEGSVTQRLAGLSAERGRLQGLIAGGDSSQIEALTQVVQQQLDLSKQAFGSTAQFAADRGDAISSLEALVRQTEARIAQASSAAAQQPTVDKLTELNTTADEQTTLQQQILAAVQALGLSGGSGGGTVSSGFAREAVR